MVVKNNETRLCANTNRVSIENNRLGNIDMKSISKLSKNENTVVAAVTFNFHETHDVRIQVIEGEPWFCLKDVCGVLCIANPRDLMAKQLDKQGVDKIYTLTDGGKQQLVYVNEPNLYRIIFRSNKQEAKQFQDWVFNDVLPTIRKSGRYERQPAADPLTPNDMNNLKRLIWLMTDSMRLKQSWSNGVWYALRAATGRPSPQPFTVDDLPVLGEECRRIMKITSAFNSAVYAFEKDVIRRVVRRRGDFEPLIAEMDRALLELKAQEQEGVLMLSQFEEYNLNELIARRH